MFKNKKILITISVLIFIFIFYLMIKNNNSNDSIVIGSNNEVINCLKEKKVVIYGTETCPFCARLVEDFGGYDVIDPIYVNCTKNSQKCSTEMKTNYVPEIQINKNIYEGERTFNAIANEVNCLIEDNN